VASSKDGTVQSEVSPELDTCSERFCACTAKASVILRARRHRLPGTAVEHPTASFDADSDRLDVDKQCSESMTLICNQFWESTAAAAKNHSKSVHIWSVQVVNARVDHPLSVGAPLLLSSLVFITFCLALICRVCGRGPFKQSSSASGGRAAATKLFRAASLSYRNARRHTLTPANYMHLVDDQRKISEETTAPVKEIACQLLSGGRKSNADGGSGKQSDNTSGNGNGNSLLLNGGGNPNTAAFSQTSSQAHLLISGTGNSSSSDISTN